MIPPTLILQPYSNKLAKTIVAHKSGVYLWIGDDVKLYCGSTINLHKRLCLHYAGKHTEFHKAMHTVKELKVLVWLADVFDIGCLEWEVYYHCVPIYNRNIPTRGFHQI